MLNIKFEEFPEIIKYIGDKHKEWYMKPNQSTILDNETFIAIVHEWIKKFEKDIDVMVENTFLVHELTCGRSGYQTLSENWTNWKGQLKNRFTKEEIRKSWEDKFCACICHLYQGFSNKKSMEIKGGAAGCLICCSFRVEFMDSELKRVKHNVVTDFNMSLEIENSLHSEIDMYE